MAEPFAPPGSEIYQRAIAASNTVARQEPAFAAAPATPAEAAACVRLARTRGLTAVPQATGHGAAGHLGGDVLLVDTSGLDTIRIDAADRRAVVGAGCRWGAVNAAAVKHGLLGRAGSAPDVGIAGYTFGAGAGWLVRPWGLASSALQAVTYVDGYGTLRLARDDAADQVDRDVVWACRGGGGVGLAVSLEFGLVPMQDLWAGYLIWPVDALGEVARAWTASLGEIGAALSSCLAVLQAPPTPAVPAALHGKRIVHLSMASTAGDAQAQALREALRAAPPPAVDTWGRSDVDRLAKIHLDPDRPVPSLGQARWLRALTADLVAGILHAATREKVQMVEIRHVANEAPALTGALDRAPGDFMLHAVGDPSIPGGQAALDAALDRIIAVAAPADTGLAVGSWSDGRIRVSDALPAAVRSRVASIAGRVDPDRILARSALIRD